MAITIASNLTLASGIPWGCNQSPLIYATNQQRWWFFLCDSTLDSTHVRCWVSSSNDLTSATWSAGTTSPAMSSGLTADDLRTMAALFLNPSSSLTTDAVHVEVQKNNGSTDVQHIRATLTGASSITWGSWVDTNETGSMSVTFGNCLGVATDGSIHSLGAGLNTTSVTGAYARKASNADTSASWTNAWGAGAEIDGGVIPPFPSSNALAPLASAGMLAVYDNSGGGDGINNTGLRFQRYASGTTWPTAGASTVGNGTSSQNNNDWGMVGIDTTHVPCIRRNSSSTFIHSLYSGSAWLSKTNPPDHNHLAGSGIFMATNGTNMWIFVLDSASNQPIQWNQYTVGTNSWGAWIQLEAAGSTARNAIGGSPVVGNNQIGVVFTAVNGSNFDINVSALSLGGGGAVGTPGVAHIFTTRGMAF